MSGVSTWPSDHWSRPHCSVFPVAWGEANRTKLAEPTDLLVRPDPSVGSASVHRRGLVRRAKRRPAVTLVEKAGTACLQAVAGEGET
jgi:hypothetical protein